MKVTVWSSIAGPISGYAVFDVSPQTTVGHLIDLYCQHKNVTHLDTSLLQLCKDAGKVLPKTKTLLQSGIGKTDQLILVCSDNAPVVDGTRAGLFQFASWRWLGVVCIVISCCALLALAAQLVQRSIHFSRMTAEVEVSEKFGVVIDAGSTHSAFFVYKWQTKNGSKSTNKDYIQNSLHLVHQCRQPGALSSLPPSAPESSIWQYLSPCMEAALHAIPPPHRSLHSPLFLAATAGFRILRDFNPWAAVSLLSSVQRVLSTRVPLSAPPRNVFIASARTEGVSGWLAANYLTQISEDGSNTTTATLDVGGASLQFTNTVPINSSDHASHNELASLVNVTLQNSPHLVSSVTYLCYGVTESQYRYRFLLVHDALIAYGVLPQNSDAAAGRGALFRLRRTGVNMTAREGYYVRRKFNGDGNVQGQITQLFEEKFKNISSKEKRHKRTKDYGLKRLSNTQKLNIENVHNNPNDIQASQTPVFIKGETTNDNSRAFFNSANTDRDGGKALIRYDVSTHTIHINVTDPCRSRDTSEQVRHEDLFVPCTLSRYMNKQHIYREIMQYLPLQPQQDNGDHPQLEQDVEETMARDSIMSDDSRFIRSINNDGHIKKLLGSKIHSRLLSNYDVIAHKLGITNARTALQATIAREILQRDSQYKRPQHHHSDAGHNNRARQHSHKQDIPNIIYTIRGVNRNSDNNIGTMGKSGSAACRKRVSEVFDTVRCRDTFVYGDCLDRSKSHVADTSAAAVNSVLAFSTVFRTVYGSGGEEPATYSAVYIDALLTEALGFTGDQWSKLRFTNKVDNKTVAWTLGFMLQHFSSTNSSGIVIGGGKRPHSSEDVAEWLSLLLLFASLLLVGVALLCHHRSAHSHAAGKYHQAFSEASENALRM